MLNCYGDQLIQARVQGRLSPVIEAHPEISASVILGLDANSLKQAEIHFAQRLANAVGILRHANRASGAAQVATAHHIDPIFNRLALLLLNRRILDPHQVLDPVLHGHGNSLFYCGSKTHGRCLTNQKDQAPNLAFLIEKSGSLCDGLNRPHKRFTAGVRPDHLLKGRGGLRYRAAHPPVPSVAPFA